MKVKAIMALNNFGFLGKGGKMMWRSSEDLKHFKEMTKDSVCIVGSKTYENDLKDIKHEGRHFVVIGSNYTKTVSKAIHEAYTLAGKVVLVNVDKKLSISEHIIELKQTKGIYVIGGKSIYDAFIDIIDEWHISKIDDSQIGDVTFEIPNKIKEKITFYKFKTNEK